MLWIFLLQPVASNSFFETTKATGKDGNPLHSTSVFTARPQGIGKRIARCSIPQTYLAQPLAPPVNDKYENSDSYGQLNYKMEKLQWFTEQQIYLKNLDSSHCSKGVKHRLRNSVEFWKSIQAPDFIISVIETGYVIPFVNVPTNLHMKNNRSACNNEDFVSGAVSELLETGCVRRVPFKPTVVNPLSVAENSLGKKRLILDLSILNTFVKKDKIKFEDWKIVMQYFEADCFMFKFDLKSGYHHIDICIAQQSFLGFSWKDEFYVFTVLPFGLCSAPYIFTKCLRPMVKFWRQSGVSIVLYLDDGIGISSSFESCKL
jgi:hypothetical protein